MHNASCFITLTYRNEDLPEVGSLIPRHLQAFHKRLHNQLLYKTGLGIRYFACGEYGDLNKRPHYHSIIFGHEFGDLKFYTKNSRGEDIFTSKALDKLWGHGECKVGAVTFESASYVARYCLKVAPKWQRERGHYEVYDADGRIHERVPEFSHMSRRPGIGRPYFDKYGAEIMQHDTIIVGGREVPSIRYYDKLFEAIDPPRFKEVKKVRHRVAMANWAEHQPPRLRVKERLTNARLKGKVRSL